MPLAASLVVLSPVFVLLVLFVAIPSAFFRLKGEQAGSLRYGSIETRYGSRTQVWVRPKREMPR